MSFPGRIIYIGFGVSDYQSKAKLHGPIKDPTLIYNAFHHATLPTFIEEHSVVIINPTGAQFIATIESAMAACQPNDLLILYFSGHAELNSNHLDLFFIDDTTIQGRCSIDRLLDIHRITKRPKLFLLLDCCHSATAATAIFKNLSIEGVSNVELLTPTAKYELAEDTKEGSPFSQALHQALGTLTNRNEPVTVNRLVNYVDSLTTSKTKLQHHRADGNMDLNIAKAQIQSDDFDLLIQSTYKRIVTGQKSERETLWFALSSEPEKLMLEIFSRLEQENYLEPCWLVRRAMGSALSSVEYLCMQSQEQVLHLLNSNAWMNVAVGLNAAKQIFEPLTVINYCINLLKSDMPMDIKWLAALYLHDIDPVHVINWDTAVLSGFNKTSWGLCELTLNLKLLSSSEVGLQTVQSDTCSSLTLMKELNHTQDESYALEILKHYSNINETALLRAAWKLHSSKPRGLTSIFGARKWLRSKLYGAWRQAISLDISQELLGSMSPTNRINFLLAIPKLVPSVPHRMAIFEGITPDANDLTYLCWGATDPHPWVRRAFLEYLCRHDFEQWQKQIEKLDWESILNVNRDEYPGQADLFLQAAETLRYQPNTSIAVKELNRHIDELPNNEKTAILKALKNEGIILQTAQIPT